MEIKDRLIIEEIKQEEIERFLLIYFGSCSGVSKRENMYSDKLRVKYNRKGKISSVYASRMDENELDLCIQEVHQALLNPIIKIGKTIFFSSYPVVGYYFNENNFLIRPVPKDSPLPNQVWAEHPFVLEFQYPSSTNWQIDIFRRQLKVKEYLYLLNAFLEGRISFVDNTAKKYWVLIDAAGKPKCEYCQHGYFPSENLDITDNYSDISMFSKSHLEPVQTYYTKTGKSITDQQLCFPDNFDLSFNKYYSLTEKQQTKFIYACHWLFASDRNITFSQSTSYLGLSNAIECLLPKSKSHGTCKECHREFKDGPTKLFYNFMCPSDRPAWNL